MSSPTQRPHDLTTFLVEHYWPGITAEHFEAAAERVRRSAEMLADTGVRILFLHSTLVPGDEAAFCVFTAEAKSVVVEAYDRAGVPYERVLDAFEVGVRADEMWLRPESIPTSTQEKEER